MERRVPKETEVKSGLLQVDGRLVCQQISGEIPVTAHVTKWTGNIVGLQISRGIQVTAHVTKRMGNILCQQISRGIQITARHQVDGKYSVSADQSGNPSNSTSSPRGWEI
ncbi:hypothetical protein RRG08_061260 [Elysia crispata]|uniref:Uncharacterized protein n=1 Tax=Elysia crispata TaxID=231223 RepID=A0AAE0ZH38_9GAST|nr:hypothetical protein RRG08_061260 [Elysia crispata]